MSGPACAANRRAGKGLPSTCLTNNQGPCGGKASHNCRPNPIKCTTALPNAICLTGNQVHLGAESPPKLQGEASGRTLPHRWLGSIRCHRQRGVGWGFVPRGHRAGCDAGIEGWAGGRVRAAEEVVHGNRSKANETGMRSGETLLACKLRIHACKLKPAPAAPSSTPTNPSIHPASIHTPRVLRRT